jgi:hypothetical protein
MHLQRHDHALNDEPGHGIVEVLERDGPGSVFSIWTNTLTDLQAVQPSVSSWPNPSLTILRGTLRYLSNINMLIIDKQYVASRLSICHSVYVQRVKEKATCPVRTQTH